MRRHLTIVALAVGALIATTAEATEVRLDLRGATAPLVGDLVVDPGGSPEIVHPLRESTQLEVPAGGPSVGCRAEGLWCPVVPLRGETVTLPVYESMTVTATLTGRAAQALAAGTVQGLVGGAGGASPVELRENLVVRDGAVSFTAPRTSLDLRFAFPGAAPVYRWGIAPPAPGAEPAAVRLGSLALQPGGSLSGWVKRVDDELPVAGATIAVFPVAGTEAGPTSLGRWEASSEANGFFQVEGLEPGTYRVEVAAREHVPQAVEAVEITAGSETLVGTVLLPSPIRLSVQVHPPVDPGGRPWTLAAGPLHPLPGELPTEATATADGVAELGSLRATEYVVQVKSADGDALLFETHTVRGDGWLVLDVPVVALRGTVRLGDEPVAAAVVLESGAGDRVEVESGEDGEISGWMRRPERAWLLATVTWSEGEETRQRKLEVIPEIEDESLTLAIELPAGAVYGEVVDSEGRSQPGFRVAATPANAATTFTEVRGETDRNGRFHLTGLDETQYLVRAGGNGLPASEAVTVDLAGDLPVGEVRLVVWPTRRIEGQLSADGQGLAGALVRIVALGRVPVSVEVPADAQGRFSFDLPEAVTQAVVTVFAPSRALWSGCVPIDGDRLALTLPPSSPGRLTLRTTTRADLPPTTGGQLVLLTGDGGFVPFGTLVNWSRLRNAAWTADVDGERSLSRLEVPGLPPASYAVTWSGAPEWELATRACAGLFQDARWVVLAPGAEAELHLDLTDAQARAQEATAADSQR